MPDNAEKRTDGSQRPLQEGYAPGQRGYVPTGSTAGLPKPPIGGTGESGTPHTRKPSGQAR
jgi:hypothetical protein